MDSDQKMGFDERDAQRFAERYGPRKLKPDDIAMVVEAMEKISLAGRLVTRVSSKFVVPASVFSVPAGDEPCWISTSAPAASSQDR